MNTRKMSILDRSRAVAKQLKRELTVYKAIASDPRTPRLAKWLLLAAIGYVLLPFDLIPDWIPVLGVVDDLIIVPGLVVLALRLVPRSILDEYRRAGQSQPAQNHTQKESP